MFEVICGGLSPPKASSDYLLELDTCPNAPVQRRVQLSLETLTERLLDDIPPALEDAIHIAAYVFAADRLAPRGSNQMARMGDDWRRNFRFKIPVRRSDIWRRHEIRDRLVQALEFLSEDNFTFDFEDGNPGARLTGCLGFNEPHAHKVKPDDVILFSGGLDSLAGAVEQIVGNGRQAVLVTHKSSTNLAKRQDRLVDALKAKVGTSRIFYAPVWVRKGDPIEFTQRTRSFLFVTLGVALSQMFQRDTVEFFENGITTFNLPIAEHVLGSRASRTTHPRVLKNFGELFSLLAEREIKIENRYLWRTKVEVVEALRTHACHKLISETTSCANVRNLAMTTKQCGVCSQCIERRIAILATGLGDVEPPEAYAIDLFTGGHSRVEDITMVEQHLLRAQRLAAMSEAAFLSSNGGIFRALSCLPGRPSENASKIYDLHRRYGQEVLRVVDAELKKHASFEAAQNVAPTSLIAMVNSPVGITGSYNDPIELEPAASEQAGGDRTAIPQRRFVFAIDSKRKRVEFSDGPSLKGVGFALITRLADQFNKDLSDEKPPEEYTFVPTRTLLQEFGVEEHALLQRVHRCRKSLQDQFQRATDYILDEHDIIQSHKWRGFRLNPYLLLVRPEQLSLGGHARSNVMTSPGNVMTQTNGR